jgi:DNA-binding transcriptional MerR regulator
VGNRVQLPDKLYFKIGEVAKLADVKQHVLRYWESEFPSIRPQKSKTNQRLYRRKDVEAVLAIKHLLYDRKFTIEGARRHLKEEGVEESLPPPDPEAVARVAREEAMGAIGEEVARARGSAVEWYEKRLLELRSHVKRFLEEVGPGPGARGADRRDKRQ